MRQILKNINRGFITRSMDSIKKAEPVKKTIVKKQEPKIEEKKEELVEETQPVANNKKKTTKKASMTTEQITAIEEAASKMEVETPVKVVKKDRGLIERTESSKIILTEDNRQVLVD